jgi:hypothetical protein
MVIGFLVKGGIPKRLLVKFNTMNPQVQHCVFLLLPVIRGGDGGECIRKK